MKKINADTTDISDSRLSSKRHKQSTALNLVTTNKSEPNRAKTKSWKFGLYKFAEFRWLLSNGKNLTEQSLYSYFISPLAGTTDTAFAGMHFVQSNTIVCSYCRGRQRCEFFSILNDAQHALMLENRPYNRGDFFCRVCINRINNKLNNRARRPAIGSQHGTTVSTTAPVDPHEINPNTTGESQFNSSVFNLRFIFVINII